MRPLYTAGVGRAVAERNKEDTGLRGGYTSGTKERGSIPRSGPMSDQFRNDAFDARLPDLAGRSSPLPSWLARRLLREDEQVAWVPQASGSTRRGRRYVAGMRLFLAALGFGMVVVAATAWLFAEMWPPIMLPAALVAGGIVLGSVMVLGFCCGYFTRLVATNQRLVILQGYEVCRTWGMDDLPPSLIRDRISEGGRRNRTVDFDAVTALLGGSSDQFVDAESNPGIGKQLGQIKRHEDGRA